MRADVQKLLLEREAQGLPRKIEDPVALRRVANVVALVLPNGNTTKPRDAA